MTEIPLPDPPLTDGVVLLRPFGADDVDHVLALWADPEVARWTSVPDRPSSALAAAWIAGRDRHRRRGRGLDLVVAESDGTACGAVSLDDPSWAARRVEAGYSLLAARRGRGRASRALRMLAGWALTELPVDRVELRIHATNAASARVAARAGFADEGPVGGDEPALRRWGRSRDGGGPPPTPG